MPRPRRETTLCVALRILDLRYQLRRAPSAEEIRNYVGLERHHAHRWAAAVHRMFDLQREEAA